MDSGLKTPLLDSFRRDDVPKDVRLEAALGRVAPRGQEQLALLAFLLDDADEDVRRAAAATVNAIAPASIAAVLARADAPVELVRFFGERGITPVAGPETSAVEDEPPLVQAPDGAWDTIDEAALLEGAPDQSTAQTLTQKVQQMTVIERVRAAMRGSREVRAMLVRDPNRMVSAAVLSSPKLTTAEVEAFAKMANVSEDVLRAIGNNRSWMKNYPIAASLTRNPKTPVAISLNLLGRLIERDVKAISIDRNVPEPLRIAARKRVVKSAP
jgi:hypothetical protein